MYNRADSQLAYQQRNFTSPVKQNIQFYNDYPTQSVQSNGYVSNEQYLNKSVNGKDFFTFKYPSTNESLKTNGSYEKPFTSGEQLFEKGQNMNGVQNTSKAYNANTDVSSKQRESQRKSTTHTLSWTNFIAMEFKTEQLENQVNAQLLELKQKSDKINNLQRTISSNKALYERDMRNLQYKYMKQIQDQKNKYEQQLKLKKIKINQLADKLLDQTKQCIAEQIKSYLSEILQKSSELEQNYITQREKNLSMSEELLQLQRKAKFNQDEKNKADSCLSKMVRDLEVLTNKILYRSGYSTESNSLLEVIQAQSAQITELTTRFQESQDQFLKIRAENTQLKNKINVNRQEQGSTLLKQKYQSNALMVALGFNLTNKQNQNNSLKRRLAQFQRKYNEAFSEHESQMKKIEQALKSTKNNTELNNQQRSILLGELNLRNHCESCLKNQRELQSIKQKFALLVN